jgi:hypothetical protein
VYALCRPALQRTFLFLLITLASVDCHAGQLLEARVKRYDGHYLLHLVMRIHARYPVVYKTLLDFKDLPKVNNTIKSARELSHKGQVYRVHMVIRGCVWIFCRTIQEEDVLTLLKHGYLMSITDPKHSDFYYGHVLWHIEDQGKTTLVTYNADFAPAFWIPPLFGPAIFKHRLLEEGRKTINGIERLSRKSKS